MRLRRLDLLSGDGTISLDLHPRLTIVAGMGVSARRELLDAVAGGIAGSRPDVRVQTMGPLSGETGETSELDDLDADGIRELIACTADDVRHDPSSASELERLAAAEPRRLWPAAEAVRKAEIALDAEIEAVSDDAEVIRLTEKVERTHARRLAAAGRLARLRRIVLVAGGLACVLAVPAGLQRIEYGIALASVAVLGALTTLVAWVASARAVRADEAALAAVGVTDYVTFSVEKTLLGDDERRRLMPAADARRAALADWAALAGEVSPAWALEHREEIHAAAQLRARMLALAGTGGGTEDDPVLRAIVGRIARARTHRGRGLPLVLVDPLRGVDPAVKPVILELLCRTAGDPQIIYLTKDEAVASWARLEAMTGELLLIEPAASPGSPEPPESPEEPAPASAGSG